MMVAQLARIADAEITALHTLSTCPELLKNGRSPKKSRDLDEHDY